VNSNSTLNSDISFCIPQRSFNNTFLFSSMQLAVDAQIPESLSGLDAEVVYIDTEGSFIVERLVDIATATVEHCKQISSCGEGGKCTKVVNELLILFEIFYLTLKT